MGKHSIIWQLGSNVSFLCIGKFDSTLHWPEGITRGHLAVRQRDGLHGHTDILVVNVIFIQICFFPSFLVLLCNLRPRPVLLCLAIWSGPGVFA